MCGAREGKVAAGFPLLVRTGLDAGRLREVEQTVLARCRDRVSPPVAPLIHELTAESTDRRILVFIQPATGTAHTFRRGKDGPKHFVRVSRSTLEARNGLLRDLLVRNGALPPWDRRPCAGATEADLDLLVLRNTLQQLSVVDAAGTPERFLSDTLTISAFVPPLLVREPLTGVLRPRNFAMLLFGREPQRFIPGAVAFFSRYPGLDRAATMGQRLELAGSLVDQMRLLLPAVEAEALTLFDKTDRNHPSVVKYPVRALREAVGNAFAHRDYERVDPLRVTAFQDRMEIVSPGALPLGVTALDMDTGPVWRNQSLAWFLTRLGYAEAEGQGLRTIQSTLREAGCPPATFAVSPVRVACTIRAHPRALRIAYNPP